MIERRIRIEHATLRGELLTQGARVRFEATVDGPKVDAIFELHEESERPIDDWNAFKALEGFIDEHLRG
jgi:hypothetical protein